MTFFNIIRAFFAIAFLAVSPAPSLLADEQARGGDILADFQLAKKEGPLLLPVTVQLPFANADGGAVGTLRLNLIVDTAATITIFDSKHAGVFGPPTGRKFGRTPSGLAEFEFHNPPVMVIGSLRVKPKGDVACLDLKSFTDALGEPVDGFLGMDVLRQLVFVINFDSRRIKFCRSAKTDWGKAVPIIWREDVIRDCPFVRVALGQRPNMEFMLDTGAAWPIAGALDERDYDDCVNAGRLHPSSRTFSLLTPNSIVAVTQARAPITTLGNHTHKELAFYRLRFPNCLSLGYLSRYQVGFDFPGSTMYLRPGALYGARDQSDRVGASFARSAHALTVAEVSPHTPAFDAGLRKSDIIVAIDGASTKDMTVLHVWQCLSRAGRHTLAISRGTTQLRLALEVQRTKGENDGEKTTGWVQQGHDDSDVR